MTDHSYSDYYYRLSKDSFVRCLNNEQGYIYSQRTKHDRLYDMNGWLFLNAISREPQGFNEIFEKIAANFDESCHQEIRADLAEILADLESNDFIVSGNSAKELDQKDLGFTYSAPNPKTTARDFLAHPDDASKYGDSRVEIHNIYEQNPHIHACQIELTNKCNERCIHCYIPHSHKNNILPFATIESILHQLHEIGTLGLTLSGGELFCHPDIEKILYLARELDFSINILSNLTLLKDEHIKVLKDINPSLVQTSLYSTEAAEHDHITALKGSFEKTVGAIKKMVAADIPVQISCPVMKSNFHNYKNILKFAQSLNCKAQTDFIMMARYDFSKDNLAERLDMQETEALIKDMVEADLDYLALIKEPPPKPSLEEWSKEFMCGVARDNLCIASNGTVYPCSGWQGMACGSVHEQSIADIWENSPQLNELRQVKKGSIPGCYSCPDRDYCATCMVRNFNESGGDYLQVPKHFCEAARVNRLVVEEAQRSLGK